MTEIGLGAERDRRQQHNLGAAPMRLLANVFADERRFQGVGAVGQMQVVRLGGAQRQNGHFKTRVFDFAVVCFVQLPGTHGQPFQRLMNQHR